MKKQLTRVNIGCLVCCALALMLLFLQFVPFWPNGEAGEMASISQYIWFPGDCTGVETMLKTTLGSDYTINQMVMGPLLLLVLCVVCAALCLFKQNNLIAPVLAAITGLVGMVVYIGSAPMHQGQFWVVHLAGSVMLMLCGIVTTYWRLTTK